MSIMQIVAQQQQGQQPTMEGLSLAFPLNPSYLTSLNALNGSSASQPRTSPTLSNRSSEDAGSVEISSSLSPTKTKETQEKQKYECPLCREVLMSQKDFTAHIRGHNEVKPHNDPNDPTGQAKVYYCCLCGKMLSSFSSLDRHMLVHSGERPFSCQLCGQTFTTNGNMHRHKRTHGTRDSRESDASSGSNNATAVKRGRGRAKKRSSYDQINGGEEGVVAPKREFKHESRELNLDSCPLCPENFYSEISLETHIVIAHPGKEIKCDQCNGSFTEYNLLKLHKNIYHHKSSSGLGSNNTSPSLPYPSSLDVMRKFAQITSATLPSDEKKVLSSPVSPAIQPPKKSTTPQICDYTNNSNGPLTPKSQDSMSESLEHDENDGLLREMKLKGEFPCRVCPSVYPNLRALKGHNKEHMTKAPYACNVAQCTYTSNDKGTLARHMRIHTGEKPFECKLCSFGFTTKANCERHVKNKHGKNSRNDIRESIVIHDVPENDRDGQSDDSTNPMLVTPRKEDKPISKPTLFRPYMSIANGGEAPLDLSRQAKSELTKPAKKQDYEPPNDDLAIQKALAASAAFNPSPIHPLPLFLRQWAAAQTFPNYFLAAQQEMLRRQMAEDPKNILFHLSTMQSNLAAMTSAPIYPPSPQMPTRTEEDDCKMVLVNGVLTKKQKQKRYRTERPYACDFCDAKFTLRSNMERHVKQQHPEHYSKLRVIERDEYGDDEEEAQEEEDDEPLIVDDNDEIDNKAENQNQMEVRHDTESGEDTDGYLDNEDEIDVESVQDMDEDQRKSSYSSSPNRIPCPECKRVFPWKSSLDRHMLTHSGDKPFKCDECPLWFSTKSNCDRHLLRKHGNNNDKEIKSVPERPFKCPLCPSSTFSSEDKLKKHLSDKHVKSPVEYSNEEEALNLNNSELDHSKESVTSDSPFKCHLCEDSFAERSEAIDHLKATHSAEYEGLVSKGAFDIATLSTSELQQYVSKGPEEGETFDQLRGRFPDYVNRKVICLFCLRKFWSAEDLRRHVRTHTGERPYSCDICQRKFTLKHSMLRHRKKHDSGVSSGADGDSDSESVCTGRSSSPEEDLASKETPLEVKKKRANLMDTINKLKQSSTVAEKTEATPSDSV